VLLAMRDDFLAPCNGHEALRPIFSELTLLDPPAGANLRRALTQPALACGYRFEDDVLVEEMVGEVAGERGALPLLAFAAARLWEKRDREAGLLTRQAYRDIGGVGGALAQHAEATMDRIGVERMAGALHRRPHRARGGVRRGDDRSGWPTPTPSALGRDWPGRGDGGRGRCDHRPVATQRLLGAPGAGSAAGRAGYGAAGGLPDGSPGVCHRESRPR
jgi:hypothetical protein